MDSCAIDSATSDCVGAGAMGLGGGHSAQMLPTASLCNLWTDPSRAEAENRHLPWAEPEPASVMQPHCPLSAPLGLNLILGEAHSATTVYQVP